MHQSMALIAMSEFISKYISASIPDDDNELKDLVVMLQKHRHSS